MRLLSISAAMAAFTCVIATCDATEPGPRLAIEVSPLALEGITDATYRLSVHAGQALVWEREVSSALWRWRWRPRLRRHLRREREPEHGHAWSFLSLSDAGGPLAADAWVAPPPVTLSAECVENADTPVVFDLTIARPARQGFFDIGVTFDDVFCSAKLDCGASPDIADDMLLLHDPRTGERATTAVLAFACSAGPRDRRRHAPLPRRPAHHL